jgi:hypothetical protein
MGWQVKNYKPANTVGAVAGRFILIIGPVEIRGWTHFRSNDGKEWVAGPSREYEKDGERKFYPYVYFPNKEQYSKFQKWALAEIKKLVPATGASDPAVEDNLPF